MLSHRRSLTQECYPTSGRELSSRSSRNLGMPSSGPWRVPRWSAQGWELHTLGTARPCTPSSGRCPQPRTPSGKKRISIKYNVTHCWWIWIENLGFSHNGGSWYFKKSKLRGLFLRFIAFLLTVYLILSPMCFCFTPQITSLLTHHLSFIRYYDRITIISY